MQRREVREHLDDHPPLFDVHVDRVFEIGRLGCPVSLMLVPL